MRARFVLSLIGVCSAALPVVLVAEQGTRKPVAGCPRGAGAEFTLGTVESVGIDPAIASGIPSLDGNGDGYTCAAINDLGNGFQGIVFRDNNVR